MSERTKAHVEEAGRVVLTDDERQSLRNTKSIFLVTVFLIVIVVVAYGLGGWFDEVCGNDSCGSFFFQSAFWNFWLMWLGGLTETMLDPALKTPKDKAITCAKTTSAAFWGMFWWFFLWIASSGKMS